VWEGGKSVNLRFFALGAFAFLHFALLLFCTLLSLCFRALFWLRTHGRKSMKKVLAPTSANNIIN
jgi:hypothetical protein